MSGARGGPRGIPTSRAYWDLQAEKLLNRVFEPAETIDLDPVSSDAQAAPEPSLPAPATAAPQQPPAATVAPSAPPARHRRARRPDSPAAPSRSQPPAAGATPHPAALPTSLRQPLLLLAVFAGAGLITAGSGVLALSQWTRFQESLQQERNLLLVERLRSFGPAAQPATPTPPAPTLAPPQQASAQADAMSTASAAVGSQEGDAGLPPPPPAEPWIQELSSLPQPQRSAPLLRVPVSPALRASTASGAAAAPTPRPRTPAGPVPMLVGVVAVPGKSGSAIFQMGGSTSTVSVGDSIGSSGWRLISSDGDGVQIEHQGEVRRISIGAGG